MGNYTIELDDASTLHVGQVDTNGVFTDLGHSTIRGLLYVNDNEQSLGHRLEIANWALTADDFVAKKEVCVGAACSTLFSISISDLSVYLPRRGHAVVTSPFNNPTMSFDIGVGMIGIGVLATTNGAPGEARFLNQADITGMFDPTHGNFTMDGSGQDSNGNAAEFHLSGRIVNHPPIAVAGPDQIVECQSSTVTSVVLDSGASFDPDPNDRLSRFQWFEDLDVDSGEEEDDDETPPPPGLIPLSNAAVTTIQATRGAHTYELHVYDGALASDKTIKTVKVVDTTPPRLSVEPISLCLWPPNHTYALLALGQELRVSVSDGCDSNPIVWIDSVTADEPDLVAGSGNTTPDAVAGTQAACLRSERAGPGIGRSYTVTVKARDASCNTSTATVQVQVPHDKAGHPACSRATGLDVIDDRCGAGAPISSCVPSP